MATVKIIMSHPHIEVEGGDIKYCVYYWLSEPINGVMDGDVGYVPDFGLTKDEILNELKTIAVAHANLQTSNAVSFSLDDVITWET